jgi:hypothetical protein
MEQPNELRVAAEKAGMSPRRFAQLSGRVRLSEWEAINAADAAERKTAEAAQAAAGGKRD